MFLIALIIIGIIVIGAGTLFLLSYNKPAGTSYTYAHAVVSVAGHDFRVEIADTLAKQELGLSGHTPLAADEGMFFDFATSAPRFFWMKDMTFPIDLLWINKGVVTGFEENMQPEPGKTVFGLKVYPSPGLSNQVLEVPAGTVARFGIKVGDEVNIKL